MCNFDIYIYICSGLICWAQLCVERSFFDIIRHLMDDESRDSVRVVYIDGLIIKRIIVVRGATTRKLLVRARLLATSISIEMHRLEVCVFVLGTWKVCLLKWTKHTTHKQPWCYILLLLCLFFNSRCRVLSAIDRISRTVGQSAI